VLDVVCGLISLFLLLSLMVGGCCLGRVGLWVVAVVFTMSGFVQLRWGGGGYILRV